MNFATNADLRISNEHLSEHPPLAARAKILLIEDDQEIADEVANDLTDRAYEVTHASTGSQGAKEARDGRYDLLIVDLLLPETDGLSIIHDLRRDGIRTPVLVVSALGAVNDRIRGLKMGGDDYVTKPFALPELAARVEALLRRPLETRATVLRVGPLELDLIERVARRGGSAIELSKSEFKLLEYFMRRPDRVVTRDMLLEDVWHYRFLPQTNLVDVHIGRLRRKVDGNGGEPLLLSVRGVGFIFRDPG
ncbi:MAG: two-component system, OmpR family, response regulator [Acetobacteraceae bacterium]|jgi:two-component system OmpR family response regulator|nr:two-component system, OmpR family, response regulator [Acetobacteraceae bacterium]